ncbi:hypothetical protein FVE85_4982 [Porphyridium purpureum]|uniref:Uncharacterized protein n=1 Tax=Porphyridium purpureum TaxID=35688 RepID=A0A5J4YRF2_PORPP|nr:hypothetical protein FVE85_4982 [Porphyridium purpureum]|eukprot:POR1420..scf236_6
MESRVGTYSLPAGASTGFLAEGDGEASAYGHVCGYDRALLLLRSVLDGDDDSLQDSLEYDVKSSSGSAVASAWSESDEGWFSDPLPVDDVDVLPLWEVICQLGTPSPAATESVDALIREESGDTGGSEPGRASAHQAGLPQHNVPRDHKGLQPTRRSRSPPALAKATSLTLSDSPSKTLRKGEDGRRRKLWDFLEQDFSETPAELRSRFTRACAVVQPLSFMKPREEQEVSSVHESSWMLL